MVRQSENHGILLYYYPCHCIDGAQMDRLNKIEHKRTVWVRDRSLGLNFPLHAIEPIQRKTKTDGLDCEPPFSKVLNSVEKVAHQIEVTILHPKSIGTIALERSKI